jgi:hypothetical protein
MAQITTSDAAPSGELHFVFTQGEFDLKNKTDSYSTDDTDLISEANAHPWLEVDAAPAAPAPKPDKETTF